MLIKKYYTIKEIQQILAVPSYRLRYLEKITDKLNIFKIKGRRHYTIKDLEFLKRSLSSQKNYNENNKVIDITTPTLKQLSSVSDKIDKLIYKFNKLAKEISLGY